jgi:2-polyprenyl-3-methyl-5-hydroxy-6-metoxy-1,4-benzoquinol methylase
MKYPDKYYSTERVDVLEFISGLDFKNKTILEIGAGKGRFIGYLKQFNPKYIDAIELVEDNRKSLESICRKVIIGNVENEKIDFNYDYILMLDTLEHLLDPSGFLKRLSKFINADTRIVISLPNNSHWTVVLGLLRDRIMYSEEGGLLDYTHYHLFTHKSFVEMIKNTPLQIISHKRKIVKNERLYNRVSLGIIRHLFTFQNFYIVGRI